MNKQVLKSMIGFIGLATCLAAQAQEYPTHAIRLIVPFAAGGSSDELARIAAEGISARLGQPVIVENRGGAGGTIGAGMVAKAEPDGYTLGIGSVGTQVVAPQIMKLNFNPRVDLVPVINIAAVPNFILASNKIKVTTLAQLIANLKAEPNKYTFASSGVGANNHIFCESILAASGTSMIHVPYKGSAPALVDLASGQVDTMCDVSSAIPFAVSGQIKALAVAAPKRLDSLPDVPTLDELGYGNVSFMAWYGLIAPKGTPPAVIDKLNAAVNAAMKEPRVVDTLKKMDAIPLGGSAADFGAMIERDYQKIGDVVRTQHIKVE